MKSLVACAFRTEEAAECVSRQDKEELLRLLPAIFPRYISKGFRQSISDDIFQIEPSRMHIANLPCGVEINDDHTSKADAQRRPVLR